MLEETFISKCSWFKKYVDSYINVYKSGCNHQFTPVLRTMKLERKLPSKLIFKTSQQLHLVDMGWVN